MRHVLVIDDELAAPDRADWFSEKYGIPGFEFLFAAELKQTRRAYREGPLPSLILLDVDFEGLG